MRRFRAGTLALLCPVVLLGGCTGGPAEASPSPTTSCEGDPSAARYTLNLNATPPLELGGVRIAPTSVSRDAKGLVGAVTVQSGDTSAQQGGTSRGSIGLG